MYVEDLMTTPVAACRPDDTLAHAAAQMWESDCGLLPVCAAGDLNPLVGVITDRDICMSALFQGKPLHDLRVADAMATTVQVCRPSDSLADAEVCLRKSQLRRLPVVDESGALVGILTLSDLAREAMRDLGSSASDVTIAGVGNTLASICETTAPSPGG